MSKKKYVIESAFENVSVQKIMQLGLDANGRIINWTDSIEDVEELNSDYINEHYGSLQDEAYQRGYEEGRKVGIKDGMCDAWEAARKIMCDDGIDMNTLCTIFRRGCSDSIIRDYSASEAIAKLKAYEDGNHSDRIEVGDIVDRYIDGKFDSRGIYLGGNGEIWDCLFWANTLPITLAYPKEQFKKTGKHYDIASILEAMKS